MDDWQLLQTFGKTGAEEAFEQLVTRHLGLVYSTALRRLNGDAALAKDVSQLVFANLAVKAHKLGPQTVLAGWLHRDTCFTALEVLRAERRRHNREQVAMSMQEPEDSNPTTTWEQIWPHIDEALNQLKPKDRHALLLRFFEQRSLAEIGERLGFGESGASRRVTRALERLRSMLAARGVTTTSAALAAVLVSSSVKASSAELASAICAAALSAPTIATTHTGITLLMASTKMKIAAVGVIGFGLCTSVFLKHHFQAKADAVAEFRQMERDRLMQAGEHLRNIIMFAADHTNQVPATLDGGAEPGDPFELVYQGTLPSEKTQLSRTVILREKKAWQTPHGLWAQTYGYADGHSQVQTSSSPTFPQ